MPGGTLAERALGWLGTRKRAYQLAAPQMIVLADLARFCRANETCFHEDARKHLMLEGRREVWLRIQNHLHLTEPQLLAIYGGKQFIVTEETDND